MTTANLEERYVLAERRRNINQVCWVDRRVLTRAMYHEENGILP